MSETSTITAVPQGRRADGTPIRRRNTYEARQTREDWGHGLTRIFVRRRDLEFFGSGPQFVPELVLTNSIEEVSA
jgi:hypothetical protein